jgi:UDP-glucuronate decarboxylase
MKNVLVTGGAGFIGYHLCNRLLSEGNYVLCMDNLYTGSKDNIAMFIENKNFQFIKADVSNDEGLCFIKDVDEIYNLACPASPIHYQRNPTDTLKASILGAFNIVKFAKRENAKVLQASTSEIYGDPIEHPQKESYFGNVNTVGSRSCYDEGKRCAETVFRDYNKQLGIDTRIVRIFNTYGERMHPNDGRVVSNFIMQALNNKNITVYGDGLQTRSFQYVSDLIEGMVRIMNGTFSEYPLFNIGNPEEITIYDLAKKIITLTGSSSIIVHKELPKDDPFKRKPDISRAKKILDWSPKVSLTEGLIKTINYFKSKPYTHYE